MQDSLAATYFWSGWSLSRNRGRHLLKIGGTTSHPSPHPPIIRGGQSSGHGGRKTFLVIDEGYLDSHEGYWVEDEEDGAEGFLEADEDAFWVYDEENYTWFQRRFQGRKMKRGFKGRRKGKGKGGKGSGGKRFFKRKKGRSNLADDQTDFWQAEGQWQDGQWNGQQWDDWSWYESDEKLGQPKAKERKERRAKEKASMGKTAERAESPDPKMGLPSLPTQPKAVPLLPQRFSLTTLTP